MRWYCRDHRCSQHIEISADRWPEDRASSAPPAVKAGVEVRPKFSQVIAPCSARFVDPRRGNIAAAQEPTVTTLDRYRSCSGEFVLV
jgi:hypothetical protein